MLTARQQSQAYMIDLKLRTVDYIRNISKLVKLGWNPFAIGAASHISKTYTVSITCFVNFSLRNTRRPDHSTYIVMLDDLNHAHWLGEGRCLNFGSLNAIGKCVWGIVIPKCPKLLDAYGKSISILILVKYQIRSKSAIPVYRSGRSHATKQSRTPVSS